ncbi:thiosulfate oxidation carrier complex protein SoxZ [Betaproteobacteria bacterium GR16-43]|nr:thiosulfate oxidation carrier complex protein SoxZ [Betaproteobacteria bacterium GR16-43]
MMNGRLQVPPSVKKGEPFEVRVLMQHPMETGFRRDMNGKAIPTNIVNQVRVTLAGSELFSAELGTGLSANPYLAFYAMADASGELVVEWSDDRGEKGRMAAQVTVA